VTRLGIERKVYKFVVDNPEGKRPLERPKSKWRMGSEWILLRLTGGCRVDSVGSG